MRRLLFAVSAVVAVLAVSACGSSSPKKPAAPTPTVQALSYLPASSPLVLTLITNPNSQFVKGGQTAMQNVPSLAAVKSELYSRLSQLGFDYNTDIRPLFGNPLALGFVGTTLTGSNPPFVVAWVTKSQAKLDALITKLRLGLRPAGTHDGATLYTAGSAALATQGATLLFSQSLSNIEQALDRHDNHQGFNTSDYQTATTGIGKNALIQVFGSLTNVLSMPSAAKARAVPWVAAIKGYGASITASKGSSAVHFHVDTSGKSLSASQLPIASGSTPPNLAGGLPILAGLRDPAQTIAFAEAAEKTTDPTAYSKFLAHEAKLKRQTGFDLSALTAMLTGDLAVQSNTRTTIARAQVSDPTSAAAMVAKLAKAPGDVFKPGTHVTSLGGGLYSVKEPAQTLTYGVIGDELVIGKAPPAQVRAYAKAPTTSAPGASGSAVFQLALAELLKLALKHSPNPAEAQVFGHLGAVVGSMSATTSGLTGNATVNIKPGATP
ncbi:MAG: DUF3352 domain-containing protein [Solirubrobacteraceae bacterium]